MPSDGKAPPSKGPDSPEGPPPGTPRFPVLPPALDERQRAVYEKIAAGPRGQVRGPLALWLYSPDLAERAQALGEFLRFGSGFPPRLSEMIILIVARHFDSPYEWSVHAPIAHRAGLADTVIQAIGEGRPPAFAAADEADLYGFVDELLKANRASDETFARMRARFGERGVVEATAIMGYYALAAYLLNAVEAPIVAGGWVMPERAPA